MPAAQHAVELRCFPSTPTSVVRSVSAVVYRSGDMELQITYRLDGDVSRLLIPPPAEQRTAVELWRHTCFEAFVAQAPGSAYHEFNFSPSGEWAVYAFDAYRQRRTIEGLNSPPGIVVKINHDQLELDAIIDLAELSAGHATAPLRLGLAAVIEATDQTISYWALHHPADKPDFHRAESFVLLLDPPQPDP
jgi:hypothetical protein